MATSINTPAFQAGGLASGLDTTSLIDKLVQLESAPMDLLRTQQAGLKTQVSTLGDLVARLASLKDASDNLGTNGALGVKVTSTNTAFTATASSTSAAGTYDITVGNLATAAKARSTAFAANTAVKAGTLKLGVQGTNYDIAIGAGSTLADVAFAIRQSGAPVSASVLTSNGQSYLSITNRSTGFTGATADTALTITESYTGTTGQALGLSVFQPAVNAAFNVDGIDFTSASNVVTDVIPGTTLTLKAPTAKDAGGLDLPETLQLDNDVDASAGNLQKFVDSYNRTMQLIQGQLGVSSTTDRSSTLAGDAAVRGLQQQLQSLLVTKVGNGSVRTLADLGIKTGRDGTLTLDKTVLATAMSRDASAVNSVFSTATNGLSAKIATLYSQQTNSTDGILTLDKKGLNDSITRMSGTLDNMQLRIDSFRTNLVNQFTAMETIVAQLKSTGNFLASSSFGLSS